MALISDRHGKGRVRVMRIHKAGDRHEVRELTVLCMLTGGAERSYTDADNSKSASTDTVKNIINVVARENLALDTEPFLVAVAKKMLGVWSHVKLVEIEALETKWVRFPVGGKPHDHSFVLDGNGKNFASAVVSRTETTITSGVRGFTFMKTTNSGWDKILKDEFTTIVETRDRMAATAMDATWRWKSAPKDYPATHAKVLTTALEVFATTWSESVQDSLYRMGMAVLAAVPEIEDISFACPNKHYLLINLAPFKLDNKNVVFLPTDEPHGQIECTVGR
jgi:urate oxidase